MRFPKKLVVEKLSFKRYILYEGGWKRIATISVMGTAVLISAFNAYNFFRLSKKSNLYSDGIFLQQAGVKGSEMGPMYYNNKRQEDETIKCNLDTQKKLQYGSTYYD